MSEVSLAKGWTALLLAVLLSSTSRAHALALPEELEVHVELCSGLSFDAGAYGDALHVELVVLGIRNTTALPDAPASADAAPVAAPSSTDDEPTSVLEISSPQCADELRVVLRVRRDGVVRERAETVRPSDFNGVGRERALALATIERLRQSWSKLTEQAAQPVQPPEKPQPDTTPPTTARAVPPAPAPAPARSQPQAKDDETPNRPAPREAGPAPDLRPSAEVPQVTGLFIGGGVGRFDQLRGQARIGLFVEVAYRLRIDPYLAFAAIRSHTAYAAATAYVGTVGVIAHTTLLSLQRFDIALGAGISLGGATADLDSTTDLEQHPLAPVALGTFDVTARILAARHVAILLWGELGYAAVGATFQARSEVALSLTGVTTDIGVAMAYVF